MTGSSPEDCGAENANRPERVGWRFIALYTLANIGGYIAFIPLLQILVPLRARGLQLASLVYSCGAGQFYAVDLALIVQVLPSLRNAGQDLGIVNLSNTIPQIIAPVLAMGLLTGSLASFRTVFLLAAGAAFLGGACALGIRRAIVADH